jgi:hypothetical protein
MKIKILNMIFVFSSRPEPGDTFVSEGKECSVQEVDGDSLRYVCSNGRVGVMRWTYR